MIQLSDNKGPQGVPTDTKGTAPMLKKDKKKKKKVAQASAPAPAPAPAAAPAPAVVSCKDKKKKKKKKNAQAGAPGKVANPFRDGSLLYVLFERLANGKAISIKSLFEDLTTNDPQRLVADLRKKGEAVGFKIERPERGVVQLVA